MLAMAISLQHYLRNQVTHDTMNKIEHEWIEKHRARLDNPEKTPRQVLLAYANAHSYTTADVDHLLDWGTWDDTDPTEPTK
jgi:hypothetical protein